MLRKDQPIKRTDRFKLETLNVIILGLTLSRHSLGEDGRMRQARYSGPPRGAALRGQQLVARSNSLTVAQMFRFMRLKPSACRA